MLVGGRQSQPQVPRFVVGSNPWRGQKPCPSGISGKMVASGSYWCRSNGELSLKTYTPVRVGGLYSSWRTRQKLGVSPTSLRTECHHTRIKKQGCRWERIGERLLTFLGKEGRGLKGLEEGNLPKGDREGGRARADERDDVEHMRRRPHGQSGGKTVAPDVG